MLFNRKKKKEQTDSLHREYGLISNCGYIMRAFLRYRKSTIFFLLTGGIAGASMSYIWTPGLKAGKMTSLLGICGFFVLCAAEHRGVLKKRKFHTKNESK